MGIQIPLFGYWPKRCLSHVCMPPEPVGSAHLRFDDARVIGKVCTWLPNVVRSPERHEEFWNGWEVKIYIWEVVIRTPEGFRGISVLYRGHRKGSGGPPGGATPPGGPHGLHGAGSSPWRAGRPPLGPMRLGLGGNPRGGAPLAWGASPPSLAAAPPLDPI